MKKINITLVFAVLVILQLRSQTYIGAGNDEGITVKASSSTFTSDPSNTINGTGLDADKMEAARFLTQATMGYDMADVEALAGQSFEAWIDDQKNQPAPYLTPAMKADWALIEAWALEYYIEEFKTNNPGVTITEDILEDIKGEIFGPFSVNFFYAWWQKTITNDDQLRQRIAYALSQILVISLESDLGDHAETLTTYYDYFLEHAFGNYRDLLEDVTMSPAMGLYLSHYNNPREIQEENLHPDENYAREIMQLFTIGLYELNLDGSRKVDAEGHFIPTYNNANIKELAKVFTGLGAGDVMPNPWVDEPFFGMDWYLADKEAPMVMFDDWHESAEKVILDDLVLPAGQSGLQDLQMTLDYLFNHPNVGPFISRQLIQRLVKSNPSPGYIERVAQTFNNNGSGTRGDLAAVVKAILLDEEARSCEALEDPDNGKLIEPILRMSFIARAFNMECMKDTLYVVGTDTLDQTPCQTQRFWLNGFSEKRALRQAPLAAPSVFNFYLPDHQPVGDYNSRNLVAPEFKLHDSSTSINYINYLHLIFIWDYFGGSWAGDYHEDLGWLSPNTDDLLPLVESPEDLYNHLDILVTRGALTDRLRNELREVINGQPNWVDAYYRSRVVIQLMMMSPDYTILK